MAAPRLLLSLVWLSERITSITDVTRYDQDYTWAPSEAPEAECNLTSIRLVYYCSDCAYYTYSSSAGWQVQGFHQHPLAESIDPESALESASYKFWQQNYGKTTCNCIMENVTQSGCELHIKTCWRIFYRSLASKGHINYVNKSAPYEFYTHWYESWATTSTFTGHAADKRSKNESILAAIQNLTAIYPGCFSDAPTSDPTLSPIPTWYPSVSPTTAKPSVSPTVSPSCQDCQALLGLRCASGFQLYADTTRYCEPCPVGTAGKDGTCSPCNDGEEATFDRTDCQKTKSTKTKEAVIGWVAGGLVSVIGGLLTWYIKKKYDERKQQSTVAFSAIETELHEEEKEKEKEKRESTEDVAINTNL